MVLKLTQRVWSPNSSSVASSGGPALISYVRTPGAVATTPRMMRRLVFEEIVMSCVIKVQDNSRLLEAVSLPVRIGELDLLISASIGVTFYPQADDVDADQLLRQADQAMYQAKLAGKRRYHIFDPDQDRSVRGHHESIEQIRRALLQQQFVLHYQPKVNMRTGAVLGAEALIRWQHPQRGLLSPASFLPIIEGHPLAVAIGEWAITTALSQIEHWRAAGLDIPVSVNIGALQLQHGDFAGRIGEQRPSGCRFGRVVHGEARPQSISVVAQK